MKWIDPIISRRTISIPFLTSIVLLEANQASMILVLVLVVWQYCWGGYGNKIQNSFLFFSGSKNQN